MVSKEFFILERPHWHANLLPTANAKGIKTVAIPNQEWFNGNDPLWKKCDLFFCTSYFTQNSFKVRFYNSKYIGTHSRFRKFTKENNQRLCQDFFHNAGLIDEDDRKSTKETMKPSKS